MGGRVQEVIGLMSKSIKEQAGIHAGKMINKLTSSYETSKQSSISKKAPDTLGSQCQHNGEFILKCKKGFN